MADIDFEELDRAVNSLMSGIKPKADSTTKSSQFSQSNQSNQASTPTSPEVDTKVNTGASKPPSTTSTASPSNNNLPNQTLAVDAVLPAKAEPANPPAPTAVAVDEAPSLASKPTGRFMDMVHESSDMLSTRTITPPSARPSRYSTTRDLRPATESTTAPLEETKQAVDKSADIESKPIQKANNQTASVPMIDGEAWSYSPFVAEVKVDKRPLGGESGSVEPADQTNQSENETSSETESTHFSQAAYPDAEAQLPAKPETKLPAELQNDIIAIESADTYGQTQTSSQPASGSESPLNPNASSVNSQSFGRPSRLVRSSESKFRVNSSPTENNSINSDDQIDEDDGDIFNTEMLGPPLKHPAKEKSGWLTVVLIIGLILIGVGISAIVYLLAL